MHKRNNFLAIRFFFCILALWSFSPPAWLFVLSFSPIPIAACHITVAVGDGQLQDLRKLSLMGMDIGAKVVEMHGAVVRFPLPAPDMLPKATHGKHVVNQREGQAVETPAQNAKQRRSAKRLLDLKERWKRYANCKLHTVLHWILKRLRFRQALVQMHDVFARRTVTS